MIAAGKFIRNHLGIQDLEKMQDLSTEISESSQHDIKKLNKQPIQAKLKSKINKYGKIKNFLDSQDNLLTVDDA